jgi:hypothetical protein
MQATRFAGTLGAIVLLVSGLVVVFGEDGAAPAPEPVRARRIHQDPDAVLRATSDALRAFLANDRDGVRDGLARMAEGTATLDPEADADLGGDVLAHARAVQSTSARARESAGAGRMEDAFRQFLWVEQACVGCHSYARRAGLEP